MLSPGGPSARWGAAGGIDPRVHPVQDPIVPGPNNTFYMAGGTDGVKVFPLSDVWRLHLSGTLSSNLPNNVNGNWDKISIGSFPSAVGEGSTVVGQQLVSVHGCTTTPPHVSCAQQKSFVLNVERSSGISPGGCPPPRLSPAVTPNLNPFSSSFSSQVFSVVGISNNSLWNDSGGSSKGEIVRLSSSDITCGYQSITRTSWISMLALGPESCLPVTQELLVYRPFPAHVRVLLSYHTRQVSLDLPGIPPPIQS